MSVQQAMESSLADVAPILESMTDAELVELQSRDSRKGIVSRVEDELSRRQGSDASKDSDGKVTFVGDKDGDGPDVMSVYGYDFPKGEAVLVNEHVYAKLIRNSHFK